MTARKRAREYAAARAEGRAAGLEAIHLALIDEIGTWVNKYAEFPPAEKLYILTNVLNAVHRALIAPGGKAGE
jgi:hypothetical protein